jgi:asparagine synthase (glutamine-hydrolysing)
VPSFTIGLDRAGPDERSQATESAEALGSRLTTVTMDRGAIAGAYPELIRAAEGPVLDTACACLLRLAGAVHGQGYKVALTGEGADEALAGYAWFKGQKIRNAFVARFGLKFPMMLRRMILRSIGGGSGRWPSRTPIAGLRMAQQELYDLLGQSRSLLFADSMWDRLGDHSAYDDLDITNDRITRWDPLNQSLYVGYKVMLAGLLLLGKGDRVAMNSSVETRYPFLDEDVVDFRAGIAPEYKLKGMTHKWLLRQVAARTLPPRIANRPKTMFRASMSGTFLRAGRPAWVDQLLSPESLRATGFFDPGMIAAARKSRASFPRITARQLGLDMGLTCVISTQLWHHIYCGGGLCDLPTWSPPGMIEGRDADPAEGTRVSPVLAG